MSVPSPSPLSLAKPRWRAAVLIVLLLAGFGAAAGRAFYLQVVRNDFLRQKGDARYSRVIEISAHRGVITDRRGEVLAVSTPVESVWASPQDLEASPQQLRRLASALRIEASELKRRVDDGGREFVYLKRQLPPDEAAKVVGLGVPGVFLQREFRRYYPAGEVLAHVIGFTGMDDNGQEGMELAFQETLSGKPGSRRVIKDRLGRIVEDAESIRAPRPGQALPLAIDLKLQYLAYRELKQAVEAQRARAGGIVVLDAVTGEVLALANVPSFNPNNRALNGSRARNRAVVDVFEPGSTLKPFTAAAALEAGVFRPETVLQTAPGYLTIGAATIRDAHPQGALTVAQVIQKSSNVGAAKMALALPAQDLWGVFKGVGFGAPTGTGFPGEAGGRLRSPKTWRPIEQATMSYGHGISVTLLQLARAYTVFANDGELKPVSLTRLDAPAAGAQVISPATARAVRAMLELAVQAGGTAPKAQVVGYRVAGKTGTAHKLEGASYAANRYVSSFVGFAPASSPRLIVAVMIDEPGAGQYYGGAVAAPVFSQVMGGALRLLNVPTDAPTGSLSLPAPDEAEVKEEV
ncbi:MAG TPA: penicillin-binding protein 2 [Burkholderiales bacterium]|nr:penicillin-binding protein 2 [Burkholderiales bacterium]